jgi:sec-independent protein translocase protein TatB
VFGLSISEFILIGVVTLIAVGPQRLPGMLKNFGQWMRKLRKMTTDVRAQTGIDDILRAEGLSGGLSELRSLVRGGPLAAVAATAPPVYRPAEDPFRDLEIDVTREYPLEGADAMGALPDDLGGDDDATEEPKVELPQAEPPNVAPPHAEVSDPAPANPEAPKTDMPKSEA